MGPKSKVSDDPHAPVHRLREEGPLASLDSPMRTHSLDLSTPPPDPSEARRLSEPDAERRRREKAALRQKREEAREGTIGHQPVDEVNALRRSMEAAQHAAAEEAEVAAHVTNELELANIKLAQAEAKLQANEEQYTRNTRELTLQLDELRAQLDGMYAELLQKDSAMLGLQERYGRELDVLRADLMQRKSDKDKDDTENTVLLKLLHSEAEKYKLQLRQLQTDLEPKERDDVKNTIVLSLLNNQLEAAREENRKQVDALVDLKKQTEVLTAKLQDAVQKIVMYEGERDHLEREADNKIEQLKRDVEYHKQKLEHLSATNSRLNEELDNLKAEHLHYKATAERRDKEAFEREVTLKSEGDHLKTAFAQLTRELDNKEREFFEKHTHTSSELESLRLKLKHAQEAHEKAAKEAFEQTTSLKADVELWRAKYEQLQADAKAAERQAFERSLALTAELDALRLKLTQEKAYTEKKEKEAFERGIRLETEVEALHRQIVQLTALNEKKDKEYVEKTILLNSEKENYKSRLEAARVELERQAEALATHEGEGRREMQALQAEHTQAVTAVSQQLAAAQEAAERWERQARETEAELLRLKGVATQGEKDAKERAIALKAEIAALKEDVERYKAVIKQLEGSVTEHPTFRRVAEEAEALKADAEAYRNQVKHLKSALSTVRIESEILDGQKTRALQEENDDLRYRVQELEREHRMVAPLMAELIATLHRHGLTTALKGEIEEYKATMARSKAPAALFGRSGSLSSPAAMGRHKISPLAPPGSFFPLAADHAT